MKRTISKIRALTLGREILIGISLAIVALMVLLYPQMDNAISAQDKSSNQSLLGGTQEPLRIISTNPKNGADNVPDDVTIEIAFNNPLTPPPPPPPPTTTTTKPPTTTTTKPPTTTTTKPPTTTTTEQPTTTTEKPTTTTEQPTTTEEPTTTEQPTTTEEPTTTEQPTTTEEPTTTEQPTTTEGPTTTEQPTTTEGPTTTEQTTTTTEIPATITRVIREGIKLEPSAGRLQIIETDHTIIINPSQDLKPGTMYTLTIKPGAVEDAAGDTLDHDFVLRFKTRKLVDTPPTVVSTNPKDGETNVPITKTIEVVFSENVRPGSTFNGITVEDPQGNPIRVDRSISKNVLFINPVNSLVFNTRYTVRIPAGAVKDSLNLELRSTHTFSFRTQAAPPPPLPTIVSTNPKDGERNVPISKTIEVTFSEDIRSGRLFNGISLEDANGNPIRVDRSINGKKLFINPVNNLAFNVLYTVTVPAGSVENLAGGSLRSRHVFSFRTQAAPPPPPPPTCPDVPAGAWYKPFMDRLVQARIIEGFPPNGECRPLSNVTRAEFTKMVILAIGESPSNAPSSFSDVPNDYWARGFIQRARELGIATGFTDGTYRPDEDITREEIVTMVIRAGKFPPAATYRAVFPDVPSTLGSWPFILAARDLGIVVGYPNGTFRPQNLATRAEAAKVISLMMDLI